MTAILIRLIVIALIFALIYGGVRRIQAWWRAHYRAIDHERNERDKRERDEPGVIDLKRSDDGVYRPGQPRVEKDKDKQSEE